MRSKIQTFIERFDFIFNDEFIENATEEEIESCFDLLKENCEKDHMKTNEFVGELEFYCNSFIASVAQA